MFEIPDDIIDQLCDEAAARQRTAKASSELASTKSAGPASSLCCDAMVGPLAQRHWHAPFRYDAEGAMIWDARDERALDVRGWGRLTGKGVEALALSDAEACKIQDDFGESVVRILNASWPNIAVRHAEDGAKHAP